MNIIFRADDFGICKGVNYGIAETINEGVVKNVGLMVNMDSAKHALQLVEVKDLCIGLHVNISLGKPVLSPDKVPSLVDSAGNFYLKGKNFENYVERVNFDEMRNEIVAQIDNFQKLVGRQPDYIDGHAIFCSDFISTIKQVSFEKDLYFLDPMNEQWQVKNKIAILPFIPLNQEGLYNPRDIFTSLKIEDSLENYLGVFHPGFLDNFILENSSYTRIRPMECEFLTSPWLKSWLTEHNVSSVSIREIK